MSRSVKQAVVVIVRSTCAIYRFVEPIWLFRQLRKAWRKIFTTWVSCELGFSGEDISFNYPITLKGARYISIGSNVVIGRRGILTAWDSYGDEHFTPEVSIGDNTKIGEDCHITGIRRIDIGSNVLIGKKVTITDNSHGEIVAEALSIAPVNRPLRSKGPVVICDNVWIGDKVTILPNVTIGVNSIIGANALVTKDVPANCVAGGVPAVVIKYIL